MGKKIIYNKKNIMKVKLLFFLKKENKTEYGISLR